MKNVRTSLTALAFAASAWPIAAQSVSPTTATSDEVVELSPFEVKAGSDVGYQATETLAGTRIRTELKDVGSAISVVTKELLNDLGATDNSTLLQYTTNAEVGGVHSTYAGLGNGQSVDESGTLRAPGGANRVRGLSNADNTRDFFVSDVPWDSFNVDRIDIQRGPNSILFGLGKPAGIVNAQTKSAEFRDFGQVQVRGGSYGSARVSMDVNEEVIKDTLSIRVNGLWDHEKFQQHPAFENDERIYGAVRYDPKLFTAVGGRTSIRAKFEHGDIDANRPRTVTPNDVISTWFRPIDKTSSNGGMGKLVLTNGFDAELDPPVSGQPGIAGDNKGQNDANDPDYVPWISGRGNQQQPMYFIDGTSGQLFNLYGGFVNKGSINSDGTPRSASSAILGQRYSGVFYGVATLPGYATTAKLPGYQYGQYRSQSMTDSSVFNFYDTLIDGNNKSEWENWDTQNVSLSQTLFDDRVGIELNYDSQQYERGGQGALGWAPTIDIDYLQYTQDLKPNPNFGRPYVQANGNGSRYTSDRDYLRASLFTEFRSEDVFDRGFLQKLIGKHRFNGVYSGEEYATENRSWNMYGTSPAFDAYTGVPLGFNDRPPTAFVYLGPSVAGLSTASGANIPGITSNIELNDGSMYHFSSQWIGGSGVDPSAAWTTPASLSTMFTDGLTQASNPANYVGWNDDFMLDILRYADGDDSLTANAGKALRKTSSFAGSWQSFWWDGAVVGTAGWRYDHVRGKDVTARKTGPRSTLDLSDSVYTLPDDYASDLKSHSTSWGAVLHINKLFKDDILPVNVSLSYNTSDNFEIAGTRRNLYGDVLGNPAGKTKDYGLLLSTKDGKYSLRAVKYEAAVTDSNTSLGSMSSLGDVVGFGLRWRNVFLYNLNAYTLDTANGSNEWRYNFDPDTSIGETQDDATARENASIAAWNEIQAHLPQKFYDYWGFSPPSNLSNPDPKQVYAYPLYATPQGLTVTSDTVSKGYEFEFTANPINNWRITFNASSTEATRSNVGGADTIDYVNYITEMMAGPAGEMRLYSGGPTAGTMLQQWNSFLSNWTLLKLQEGASSSEIRKWRFNFINNYTFRDGLLKGVSVGGSYRWQDKVVLGYPVVPLTASTYSYDLENPYFGPAEKAVDLWVGYDRKLTEKINWKIQLNIRNAFANDGLIPLSVQPDGKTWASVRVKPTQNWFLTNTFSF